MSRAQRRHDTRRIKARLERNQKTKDWEATDRDAGVFANHGKVCSCWMCCNPRRLGELTVQELRADHPIQE